MLPLDFCFVPRAKPHVAQDIYVWMSHNIYLYLKAAEGGRAQRSVRAATEGGGTYFAQLRPPDPTYSVNSKSK